MTLTPGKLTISVVLYKNDPSHLEQLCNSLTTCNLEFKVHFFDNSPTDELSQYFDEAKGFNYQWSQKNIGYGPGHNMILDQTLHQGTYHLAMNADVFFEAGTLERIVAFMDQKEDVGLLLPRVLNPDGTEQPLYKLLPKPQDLFVRRFIPGIFKNLFEKSLQNYRMSFADELSTFDAPYLSGCFMFMRKEALRQVGSFDPRFFLYCEDVDLSRRIRQHWRTTYFADAHIYHYFYKGSYRNLRLLRHHVTSAVKYFNKYGWLHDTEREQINSQTLEAFISDKKSISLSQAK